jgi:large subunit ribosomal protein L16
MVRNTINRKLDETRMFAIWRIDAPWKPMTRKGQGHRMGGGKGAVDHYTTPVKAGRIIMELGGECEYGEVFPFMVSKAAIND